jgi:hypothetical protein
VPEAAGSVTVAPEATSNTIVRPACVAEVRVTFAVTLTREPEPEINPAVDVTGPEKVVDAIAMSSHASLVRLSACRLLGQSDAPVS